jgi:hypothetical protein
MLEAVEMAHRRPLVTLLRCFFYCKEKKKEYSQIFYYLKSVWNLIMRMTVSDLLKQTLGSIKKQEMKTFYENN